MSRREPIDDSVGSRFTDRTFTVSVCLEDGSLATDCNFHRKVKPSAYMSTRRQRYLCEFGGGGEGCIVLFFET